MANMPINHTSIVTDSYSQNTVKLMVPVSCPEVHTILVLSSSRVVVRYCQSVMSFDLLINVTIPLGDSLSFKVTLIWSRGSLDGPHVKVNDSPSVTDMWSWLTGRGNATWLMTIEQQNNDINT